MRFGMISRNVEAEAGGASGGEAFLESLKAEAEASKTRLRLHLRKGFENFIFSAEKQFGRKIFWPIFLRPKKSSTEKESVEKNSAEKSSAKKFPAWKSIN